MLDVFLGFSYDAEKLEEVFKAIFNSEGKYVINIDSDGKSASFSINNMVLNETVTITYVIENGETDVDAILSNQTALTGNTEFFEASYVIDDSNVKASKTTTVTVSVKMKKTPAPTKKLSGWEQTTFGYLQ